MTRPMLPRLGAACGIVFPIAMFLAVGNGNHFTPWRAVAATWALVLALPFLSYLWSLLRAAEGEGGWLSTTALAAGVSGILLKLASHAPELAIHHDRIANGTQLYKALDLFCGPRSSRGPGSHRHPDLPFVAEWVDDPAEPPAVLVAHRGQFRRASGDRLPDDAVGVFDHKQRSAGRAVDCAGAEPLHRR